MKRFRLHVSIPLTAFTLILTACATPEAPLQSVGAVPPQWYAPLPQSEEDRQAHGGRTDRLGKWWSQFNDGALT